MQSRDFNSWLQGFYPSIAGYRYYTDFDKVQQQTRAIHIQLNILNSLLYSNNIRQDFIDLLKKYPEVLPCIPILLAVREKEIYCSDSDKTKRYIFTLNKNHVHNSYKEYADFMEKTGLFEIMTNRSVTNLIDYVFGINTGLDSNARKNRGGDLMENLVEYYLNKCGLVKGETYFKELTAQKITNTYNLDLSSLTHNNRTVKRFDFVIKAPSHIVAIECNFYASGGSKLNETARSYKSLALAAQNISGFRFVWITDGIGWQQAKHNLQEAFDSHMNLLSIRDLENGILAEFL